MNGEDRPRNDVHCVGSYTTPTKASDIRLFVGICVVDERVTYFQSLIYNNLGTEKKRQRCHVICPAVSVNGRLDVNVALNRPSYQVSTHTNPQYATYYARYANDGKNATHLQQPPHCAKTNSATNPWWSVDLGVDLCVWGVKFTNRGDCCGTYTISASPHKAALRHFRDIRPKRATDFRGTILYVARRFRLEP